MNGKATAVLLSGMLFACAPVTPASVPPPVEATPPVAIAPPVAVAPAPQRDEPRVLAIRTVSCGGVLGAPEEDRAAASMFYLGFAASRLGIRTINTDEIEGLLMAALNYCIAHPDRPAVSAFIQAFRETRS